MAMRIASLDETQTSSSAGRGPSSGRAEKDRNKKVNEIVSAIVGLMTKEKDLVVTSGSQVKIVERHEFEASNTRLEHEICRHGMESRVSGKSVHLQGKTGESVEDEQD